MDTATQRTTILIPADWKTERAEGDFNTPLPSPDTLLMSLGAVEGYERWFIEIPDDTLEVTSNGRTCFELSVGTNVTIVQAGKPEKATDEATRLVCLKPTRITEVVTAEALKAAIEGPHFEHDNDKENGASDPAPSDTEETDDLDGLKPDQSSESPATEDEDSSETPSDETDKDCSDIDEGDVPSEQPEDNNSEELSDNDDTQTDSAETVADVDEDVDEFFVELLGSEQTDAFSLSELFDEGLSILDSLHRPKRAGEDTAH